MAGLVATERICPSLRRSPPLTAPSLPLDVSRGAQTTSPFLQSLKVEDTSGFLPSGLLHSAGTVHMVRDAQRLPPASASPALAFTLDTPTHSATHSNTPPPPPQGSSYCNEQRRRGFCPGTGSLISSAQRGN